MELPYVLADQVELGRVCVVVPEARHLLPARETQARQVVHESVDPNIDDLGRVTGERNAPSRRAGRIA